MEVKQVSLPVLAQFEFFSLMRHPERPRIHRRAEGSCVGSVRLHARSFASPEENGSAQDNAGQG
jgi:hypothetical protein